MISHIVNPIARIVNSHKKMYFAGLVAVRLGIPFRRIRVYYSATLPAVLQTPKPSQTLSRSINFGPVAGAAAGGIEAMCDRVIEKDRSALAPKTGPMNLIAR